LFSAQSRLDSHLFEKHRNDGFYLRVNGRVANDIVVVGTLLEAVTMHPLGSAAVQMTVSTPNGTTELIAASGVATPILASPLRVGRVTVNARSGVRRRTYDIYVGTAPDVDLAPLDRQVQSLQPLMESSSSDAIEEMYQILTNTQGTLRHRYAAGFYEYLLSISLEREGKWSDASAAMERAWGRLGIFNTDLAKSARSVLAFRMDALEFLAAPSTRSRLAFAAIYLMHRSGIPTEGRVELSARLGVWVDPFQETLLRAIESMTKGDCRRARTILEGREPRLDDAPSYRQKLPVIEARISACLGERATAVSRYRELLDHPLFGEEAKRYLE